MPHTGSSPEAAILRLVRTFGPKPRQAMLLPPLSPDDLADRLRTDRRRCLRSLFELIDQGRLGAEFHPGGRLRLWTLP
jgi:hypothetical protein